LSVDHAVTSWAAEYHRIFVFFFTDHIASSVQRVRFRITIIFNLKIAYRYIYVKSVIICTYLDENEIR